MSKDSNAKIFSIIGGCRRSGRWLVPAKNDMLTLFGRAVIDLREAQTDAEELEFTCLSVFANITFIVPEGAEVRPSGMAILGSSRCVVPVTDRPSHLPPISVDATTVFGRLRVRTTETDPDDGGRGLRFRRKRAVAAAADTAATATGPGFADAAAPAPSAGVNPIDFRASPEPATVEAIPIPTAPTRRGSFDADGPIPPFAADDETSPIEGVEVPDTVEGAEPDTTVPAIDRTDVDEPSNASTNNERVVDQTEDAATNDEHVADQTEDAATNDQHVADQGESSDVVGEADGEGHGDAAQAADVDEVAEVIG